jgi:DNA polymerase III epsilon subunit-like protein
MNFLVFDTETTGIPKHPNAQMKVQPRAIEFGAVLCDEEGNVIREFETLFNPGEHLEEIITKITGLTDDDLKDAPTFEHELDIIKRLFAEADVMVAHNLPFDFTIIQLELDRLGVKDFKWPDVRICTVQEFSEQYGRRPRLEELFEDTMGEKLDQSHRALEDCHALMDVCLKQKVFEYVAAAAS